MDRYVYQPQPPTRSRTGHLVQLPILPCLKGLCTCTNLCTAICVVGIVGMSATRNEITNRVPKSYSITMYAAGM